MTTGNYSPLDPVKTSHFVTLDNIRTHYQFVRAAKELKIPIVFTHGGGPGSSSWNNFLYNARAFSEFYDCYFYDLPGYGDLNFVPIRGPVFSWYAERFLAFLDALKIEKAHLISQSFGGSMTIKVAATSPDRVGCLVFTGARPMLGGLITPVATTRARKAVQDYYGNGGPNVEKMRALIAELEFFDGAKITQLNVQSRYETSIKTNVQAFMSNPANRGEPESLVELFRNVASRTLIVHGLHDAFCSIDVPMFMVNQFADARLHVIKNAAHHVQTECADEYNTLVLGFLSQ